MTDTSNAPVETNAAAPTEHVVNNHDASMSDEAALEQQMNAAFEKRQQQLNGEQPQQTQQAQPEQVTPTTESLTSEIEQAFQQPEQPAELQQPQQPEQPPEEANDRVKYLQQVFKDTLGVDVGEAVQTMTSFNETAQSTMQQMQAVENRIALQQQRLDLMSTWSGDAQQMGVTPTELVNQRLAETTKVFSTLNENLRQRIASQGSKGIIDLYNLIQKNRSGTVQQTQPQMAVPAGRANIATTPQGNNQSDQSLSELVATKSDDDFWRRIQQGYNDDLGLRR